MKRTRYVKKISDGEKIDLLYLHNSARKRLHYEEERYVAQKALSAPPFSMERKKILQEGYALVNQIMAWYYPVSRIGCGMDISSVQLICEFIKKQDTLLYEAGVGDGYACDMFLKYPQVSIKGCDIVLSEKMKRIIQKYQGRICVKEETLYENLQGIDDESIDIFYADNVFEHLMPDEFHSTMKLLTKKLKKRALLFLVIPNRFFGPSDVSKFFLEKGQPAQGFHFMEKSYNDVLEEYKKYGIHPVSFTYRSATGIKCISDTWSILNRMKLFVEKILHGFLDTKIGIDIWNRMAMCFYILEKK